MTKQSKGQIQVELEDVECEIMVEYDLMRNGHIGIDEWEKFNIPLEERKKTLRAKLAMFITPSPKFMVKGETL